MSQVITDNIQIIQTLCRSTVSFDGLLEALNRSFPDAGWTAEILQSRLIAGIRQGLFLPVGGNPAGPVEGYMVNKYALNVNNPQNKIYACYCNNYLPLNRNTDQIYSK